MHDKNIYKENPPDFTLLASKYPTFAPYVIYKRGPLPTIDWKNPESVRQLTTALLDHDFHIKIQLPENQLCPTVTSRSNYLLWLSDLLEIPKISDNLRNTREIRGIDIGTGSSCIYPLLGVSMFNWYFLATDIDPESLFYAQKNIALNHWQEKIKLQLVTDKTHLFQELLSPNDLYDFTMCNPPFFDSLSQKLPNPYTHCEAKPNELVTEGGELQFITKMIEESLILKLQIRWYTSMIGRKANLAQLIKILQKNKIRNYRTTAFYQGYTTRWGLAWSFGVDGLEDNVREKLRKSIRGKRKLYLNLSQGNFQSTMEKMERFFLENDLNVKTNYELGFMEVQVYDSSKWYKIKKNVREEKKSHIPEVTVIGISENNIPNVTVIGEEIGKMSGFGPNISEMEFSLKIEIYSVSSHELTVQVTLTQERAEDSLYLFGELYLDIKLTLQTLLPSQ